MLFCFHIHRKKIEELPFPDVGRIDKRFAIRRPSGINRSGFMLGELFNLTIIVH
jgi:hypothetical protein